MLLGLLPGSLKETFLRWTPKTHFLLLLMAVAVSFLCSSCTGVAIKGEPQKGFGLPSEQEEIEFGHYVDAAIQNDFIVLLPSENPWLYEKITKIGTSLVKVSDRPHLKYTFRILNTPIVNAFAGPGGYIYVTTGLLKFAKNVDEIAGVMAHELGHVCARHAVKQFRNVNYATAILFPILVASEAYGYSWAGNLSQLAAVFFLMGYSRDYERQADYLAVKYMIRAGYRPEAMVSFLERLWEEKEKGKKDDLFEVFFSSHPHTQERIRYIKEYIKELRGERR